MAKPKQSSWKKMKRAARYLMKHAEMTYMYKDVPGREVQVLHTYSDSDWAGCHSSRRSTSGGMATCGSVGFEELV